MAGGRPASGRQGGGLRFSAEELSHNQDGLRRRVMVGSGNEAEGTEPRDDKVEATDLGTD